MADKNEFIALRKKVIEKTFGKLNKMQFDAVTSVDGAMLVLAGAGSGKTTMLVNRVACVLRFGSAYNSDYVPPFTDADIAAAKDYLDGKTALLQSDAFCVNAPKPWQVLAITFTNKAAGEITDRLNAVMGEKAAGVWTGTFHSVCGRMLRRYADKIGYTSDFTIYDEDDRKRALKDIYKKLNVDEKMLPLQRTMSEIGRAKDSLISPAKFHEQAQGDIRTAKIADIYLEYSKRMKAANAMDFDDMIFNAVMLLVTVDEARSHFQSQFKYIFVDEYQDTSHAQYMLVKLLAGSFPNICVVGDDDQSIYRFRGATIENILNFEEEFDSAVIRLEQNYRSSANILNAANAVIANNRGRKGKNLWTDKGDGEKIRIHKALNETEEARFVAEQILENVRKGGRFCDHAILYRANALSRGFENAFARSGIPYRVIGGHRFYDRKEIKDILAYLCVAANPTDRVRLKRIINEPKRGIGTVTIDRIDELCDLTGIAPLEIMKNAAQYKDISRAAGALREFADMMQGLVDAAKQALPHQMIDLILEKTGYAQSLYAQGHEGLERMENVKELISAVMQYEQNAEEPSVQGYLQDVALITDIDSYNADNDLCIMMTIHAAKGMEFKNVFLVGFEESIFPSSRSTFTNADIEEERRLAYVAITRAKEQLYMTHTSYRMLFGATNRNAPSRFLEETPKQYCEIDEQPDNTFSLGGSLGYGFGSSVEIGIKKPQTAKRPVAAEKKDTPSITYRAGQRIKHKTFGEGLVVKATPMGNDTLLEIAFDSVGTKKLMANYSPIELV